MFPAGLASAFQQRFVDAGVEVRTGRRVESGSEDADGVTLTLDDGSTITADAAVAGLGIDPRHAARRGRRPGGRRRRVRLGDARHRGPRRVRRRRRRLVPGPPARHPPGGARRQREGAGPAGRTQPRRADEPYEHTPMFYSNVFDVGTRPSASCPRPSARSRTGPSRTSAASSTTWTTTTWSPACCCGTCRQDRRGPQGPRRGARAHARRAAGHDQRRLTPGGRAPATSDTREARGRSCGTGHGPPVRRPSAVTGGPVRRGGGRPGAPARPSRRRPRAVRGRPGCRRCPPSRPRGRTWPPRAARRRPSPCRRAP